MADARRQALVVLLTALGTLVTRLDTYAVSVSLPTLARQFHLTDDQASWMVTAFLLFMVGSLMSLGRVTDRVGPWRMLTLGFLAFAAGALLCGLAPSAWLLFAARAVQGLGAAMLLIATFTAIPLYLPPERRGRAFGLVTLGGGLGMLVGPLLGAWLISQSWRWVFLVNVPVGFLAVAIAARGAFPAPERRAGRVDGVGSLLAFASVAAVLYALNQAGPRGWGSLEARWLLGASAAAAAGFLLWERRHPEPLLDVSLLRSRPFLSVLIMSLMFYVVWGGCLILMPFYLEVIAGLDVKSSGMVLTAYPLAYVITAAGVGRAADRLPPRALCVAGVALAGLALLGWSRVLGGPGLAAEIGFLACLGVAFGCFITPANKLAMSSVPSGQYGAAAALYTTMSNLGAALGAAAFAAVLIPSMVATFQYALLLGVAVCLLALLAALL